MAAVPSTPIPRHRQHNAQASGSRSGDQSTFSQLLTTALGSPFLTTPDLPDEAELVDGAPIYVPYAQTVTRPPSPTPTVDSTTFSFIHHDQDAPRTPFKAILPRIWQHISPGMRPISFSFPPSTSPLPYSSRRKSKVRQPQDSPGSLSFDELEPLDGEEGELITIDDEACFFFDAYGARAVTGLDILALLPTELALHILIMMCVDEEGPAPSTSLPLSSRSNSPIVQQPYHALSDIIACLGVSKTWRALAADNTVWRALFLSRWPIDFALKRGQGKGSANAQTLHRLRVMPPPKVAPQPISIAAAPTPSMKNSLRLKIKRKQRKLARNFTDLGPSRLAPPQLSGFQPSAITSPVLDISPVSVHRSTSLHTVRKGPLQLNWYGMYRERMELDKRWNGVALSPAISSPIIDHVRRQVGDVTSRAGTPASIPIPGAGSPLGFNTRPPSPTGSQMPSYFTPYPTQSPSEALSRVGNTYQMPFAPKITSIPGHTDSVYCLQFDSKRIITGSRDRTIKVWSLKGRLLGSFGGTTTAPDGTVQGHRGSVLCLKFSPDWDRDEDKAEHKLKSLSGGCRKKGFMVTGSSDCTICIWDLYTGRNLAGPDEEEEREVHAEVVATLKGHTGGVLDLRVDDNWIVSCSKDASVHVWDRKTYELKRVLRGHEGPVNAIGLQSGRVVSASGDGKMILWDIENGERIRTFEGHNRGLACIEFKDDLIVSGSNDCKIKVWSASTGECICTLGGHEALVRALAFEPRTGRLVSASYDKSVKVWNLFTGKLVQEFRSVHTSHIFDVKFDVARIVSASHDQKIVVLDFSQGLDTAFFA